MFFVKNNCIQRRYLIYVLADFLFYNCNGLTTLELLGDVTVIGAETFEFCTKLTSFKIPKNVNSIGPGAFQDCYRFSL